MECHVLYATWGQLWAVIYEMWNLHLFICICLPLTDKEYVILSILHKDTRLTSIKVTHWWEFVL